MTSRPMNHEFLSDTIMEARGFELLPAPRTVPCIVRTKQAQKLAKTDNRHLQKSPKGQFEQNQYKFRTRL